MAVMGHRCSLFLPLFLALLHSQFAQAIINSGEIYFVENKKYAATESCAIQFLGYRNLSCIHGTRLPEYGITSGPVLRGPRQPFKTWKIDVLDITNEGHLIVTMRNVPLNGRKAGCVGYMTPEKPDTCSTERLADKVHIHRKAPYSWRLVPTPGERDTYQIIAEDRAKGCLRYLGAIEGCKDAEHAVHLYPKDDGSGLQRWILRLPSAGRNNLVDDVPVIVSAAAKSPTAGQVYFTAPPGSTSCTVTVSPGGHKVVVNDLVFDSDNRADIEGLTADSTYTAVVSCNLSDKAKDVVSQPEDFTTPATTGVPAFDTLVPLDPNSIYAVIIPPKGPCKPTSYLLTYVSADGKVGGKVTIDAEQPYGTALTSTTIEGLRANTQYSVKVKAKCANGEFSDPSEPGDVELPEEGSNYDDPVIESINPENPTTAIIVVKGPEEADYCTATIRPGGITLTAKPQDRLVAENLTPGETYIAGITCTISPPPGSSDDPIILKGDDFPFDMPEDETVPLLEEPEGENPNPDTTAELIIDQPEGDCTPLYYRVLYSPEDGSHDPIKAIVEYKGEQTDFTLAGLKPDTVYTVIAIGVCENDEKTDPTPEFRFRTDRTDSIDDPVITSIGAPTPTSVVVDFIPSPGASECEITLTPGGATKRWTPESVTNERTFTGLTPSTTYTAQAVCTVPGVDTPLSSNEESATTPDVHTPGLTADPATDTTDIEIRPPKEGCVPLYYDVTYQRASGGPVFRKQVDAGPEGWARLTLIDLVPEVDYVVTVVGVCPERDETPPSDDVVFTTLPEPLNPDPAPEASPSPPPAPEASPSPPPAPETSPSPPPSPELSPSPPPSSKLSPPPKSPPPPFVPSLDSCRTTADCTSQYPGEWDCISGKCRCPSPNVICPSGYVNAGTCVSNILLCVAKTCKRPGGLCEPASGGTIKVCGSNLNCVSCSGTNPCPLKPTSGGASDLFQCVSGSTGGCKRTCVTQAECEPVGLKCYADTKACDLPRPGPLAPPAPAPPESLPPIIASDACDNIKCAAGKACLEGVCVGSSEGLQVSIVWYNKDVDIDLHLVDPKGCEINWNNKSSCTAGRLDLDNRCQSNSKYVAPAENIFFDQTALAKVIKGEYQVAVNVYEQCGTDPASEYDYPYKYTLIIRKNGQETVYDGEIKATDSQIPNPPFSERGLRIGHVYKFNYP